VIILDTNVLSELMKPAPQVQVVEWLAQQPVSSLFTMFITEAEILYGHALLPEGARKNTTRQAITGMSAILNANKNPYYKGVRRLVTISV
jgi:predicted nucleic acid-binding protein